MILSFWIHLKLNALQLTRNNKTYGSKDYTWTITLSQFWGCISGTLAELWNQNNHCNRWNHHLFWPIINYTDQLPSDSIHFGEAEECQLPSLTVIWETLTVTPIILDDELRARRAPPLAIHTTDRHLDPYDDIHTLSLWRNSKQKIKWKELKVCY